MECRVTSMIFKVLLVVTRNVTIVWCMTSRGLSNLLVFQKNLLLPCLGATLNTM